MCKQGLPVLWVREVCRNQSCGASLTPGIAPAKQRGVGNELCKTLELPAQAWPQDPPPGWAAFNITAAVHTRAVVEVFLANMDGMRPGR